MEHKETNAERIRTVSIVDDDASVRKALSRACCWLGYETLSFDSAEAFLKSGAATDCLVTDVGLPGISGLELQETICDNGPHMPVILMTGRGDASIESRAMANGADGFFRKPLELEELLECIQRTVER
jgi:FixJ family two-component response regulator